MAASWVELFSGLLGVLFGTAAMIYVREFKTCAVVSKSSAESTNRLTTGRSQHYFWVPIDIAGVVLCWYSGVVQY